MGAAAVACPGLAGLDHGAKPLNRCAARLSGKQGWQCTHKPRPPSVPATCLCERALPRPLRGRPHYGRRRLLFALPARDSFCPQCSFRSYRAAPGVLGSFVFALFLFPSPPLQHVAERRRSCYLLAGWGVSPAGSYFEQYGLNWSTFLAGLSGVF